MSIKQERITEPRVICIKSWVQCDGCGAKMSDPREDHSAFGFKENDTFTPHFEMMSGWSSISRGSHTNRTYAHACPKCLNRGIRDLFEGQPNG